jgi:hypothetical protein
VVALGGEASRLPVRFARTVAFHGHGETTIIGPTDSLDLSVFRDTSLVVRLISAPTGAAPSRRDIANWERAIRREHPDVAAVYLEAIASAPAARTLPALQSVRVDEAGQLWAGAYAPPDSGSREWVVFSPDGMPRARLTLPALADPMIPGESELLDVRGDRLALARVSASGEPFFEVRRIVRAP